ncbi:MAG: enoyl-CoA hydratase/isomerase family protein [Gemmatimonadales bacterium]
MLHREDRSGIVVLRIDHGKAHALDIELSSALKDTLDRIETDQAVKGVVLTGTGSIFSAGVDLFRIVEGGPDYIDEFLPSLAETFLTLFQLPRPVIAAINGHAIAGGCMLAISCDYRIMAEDSGDIGVPELRVGVPFPLVAMEILRFATSEAHLQELVYLGRSYSPRDAQERGLVDEVVDADALLDRALEVVTRLAAEPSARFRITKRQLRTPTIERIASHGSGVDKQVLAAWKDPATLVAITQYVQDLKSRRAS